MSAPIFYFTWSGLILSTMLEVAPAGFLQGQVPEFTLGVGQWDGRRSFLATAIAVDPVSGKVFISDEQGHRVLRFPASVSMNFSSPDVTEAEAVFGQPDVFSAGPGSRATGLNTPLGLAFDSLGSLYVADSGNHRIARYRNAGSLPSGSPMDGALGQVSLVGNAFGAGPASLNSPRGVAMLGDFLAVADAGNHRVQVFTDFQSAFTGASSSHSYGTGTAGTSATALNQPTGVAISTYGTALVTRYRLWVADGGNNRVLRFDELQGTPVVDGIFYDKTADGVLGQSNFTSNTRDETTVTDARYGSA